MLRYLMTFHELHYFLSFFDYLPRRLPFEANAWLGWLPAAHINFTDAPRMNLSSYRMSVIRDDSEVWNYVQNRQRCSRHPSRSRYGSERAPHGSHRCPGCHVLSCASDSAKVMRNTPPPGAKPFASFLHSQLFYRLRGEQIPPVQDERGGSIPSSLLGWLTFWAQRATLPAEQI